MSDAKMLGIEDLELDQIEVGTRVRPVSEIALEGLISSYEQLGGVMADEIHVRKLRSGNRKLIAGGHRLAMAKRLEWPTIKAKIWNCSADWARLWELDDNLAHAELDTLELATFLAERKAVFLKMHPEKKQGLAGGLVRQGSATDIVSVAKTIADKRGISERHVYRLMKAGEMLSADEVRWLREAKSKATLADLTAIAKEGDAHRRTQAIISFSNGVSKNVRAALAADKAKPVKSPVETAHEGLLNAFRRAPMAAKRAFVRDSADELHKLLADLADGGPDA